MSRSKFLRDAAHLSFGTIITFIVSLLGSILIPRFLDPVMFGIWKTFQVILQYTGHSHLGLINAMVKEAPPLYAQTDRSRFIRLTQSVFSLLTGVGVIEAIVVCVFAWRYRSTPGLAISFLILGLLTGLQQVHLFYDTYLTVTKDFRLKSRLLSGFSVMRTLLMILAVRYWGFEAMVAAFGAAQLIVIVWIGRKTRILPQWRVDWNDLPRLLGVGLPIFGIVMIETIVLTTDRLVTVGVLGLEAMGYYGLAGIVTPLILLLPGSLRQVLSVEVYHRTGESGRIQSVASLFRRSIQGLVLTMPWIGGAAYLGADWGVRFILPRYFPGLPALQLLCIGVFPLALTQVCFCFLVVARCEMFTIITGGIIALANVAFTLASLAWGGGGLIHIAGIHCAGFLVWALLLLLKVDVLVGEDPRGDSAAGSQNVNHQRTGSLMIHRARLIWQCLWPWGYAAVVAVVLDRYIHRSGPPGSIHVEFGWMVCRIVLLGLAALPILWRSRGMLRPDLRKPEPHDSDQEKGNPERLSR